jgi:hypothetical protein
MKTFEGSNIRKRPLESDEVKVVFPMYLLRAVSVTIILLLFFYMAGRSFGWLDFDLTFPGFLFNNVLATIALSLFFFLVQALFYAYQIRRNVSMKRSMGDVVIGYALPLIGIIVAVYVAYAIGAM